MEGVGATRPRHQLHLLDNVYLDNGKNLYSAGVESAVNHLHSDCIRPHLLPQHCFVKKQGMFQDKTIAEHSFLLCFITVFPAVSMCVSPYD